MRISLNFRGGYYKPFYKNRKRWVEVKGVPVPKSEKVSLRTQLLAAISGASVYPSLVVDGWIRARYEARITHRRSHPGMRAYVVKKGAFLAMGLQHSNVN